MLINAEKHLDIFKKIVEISRCFVQKNDIEIGIY